MRFGLLGPLEIVDEAERPVDLRGPQPRLLLTMLLAAAGRVVSADAIIDAMWGDDPPAAAAGTVQSYISRLRRELDPDRTSGGHASRVLWEPPGYRLRVDDDELDFVRFERLAGEGRALLVDGRPDEAHRVLVDALALWRGPALGEYHDRDFARGVAARLDDRRLAALDDRIAADLALGRHAAIVGELFELVDAHPFQEVLRAHLATALYRAGRQADALRTVEDARRMLRDELGLDLSPQLRALEHAVLSHDASLDAPTVGQPSGITAVSPLHTAALAGTAATAVNTDMLVGRDAELRVLLTLLAEATNGTRVAILEGEPGIGKTRLAEELGREASRQGAAVLWGRALEGGASPAFWPWLPPLRSLVNGPASGTTIAPELATLLAPASAVAIAPEAAEVARHVLSESIVALLDASARGRQLVLVIDDIQWADVASLELLTTIPGRLIDAPLLIIATVRALEMGRHDALVDTLAALTRVPGTRRVALRGLSRDDTAALIEQATGDAADAATVEAIHERAEGNPFFTTELARLLASGVDGTDVPSGVRDVVHRRVSLLPPESAELLQVAAIIGRDIDIELLVATSGRDLDSCLDDLEPAMLQRLLLPAHDSPGSYRFAHALVREVLSSEISPLKKARLHLCVADALDDSDDNAEIVAEHLWQAVPIGVGRRAAAALERAGLVALRRFAYAAADDLLARAVQLHRPNTNSRDELEAELRAIMLRTSVQVALHGYPVVLGQRSLVRGQELAASLGRDTELLSLLWAEWAGFDLACEYRQADTMAVDLLGRFGASDDPHARVLGHLAYGISRWHRGDITESAAHLEAARAASVEIPHDSISWVIFDRDQVRLANAFAVYVHDLISAHDDADARYDAIIDSIPGDRYWEMIVCSFATSSALSCGDVDRVLRAGRRGIAADPDASYGLWSKSLRCFYGAALALGGDMDQGLPLLDEAWAAFTQAGMQTNGLTFLSSRAQALAQVGRLGEAAETLADARRQLNLTDERFAEPTLLLAEAVYAHATGNIDDAAERFAAAAALASRQGSFAIAAHIQRSAHTRGLVVDVAI